MSIEKVSKYLNSDVRLSYFLITGDDQYQYAKEKMSEFGLKIVKVSDYCQNDDKLPDIDKLLGDIKVVGENKNDLKIAIIGLGEYLALRGSNEIKNILSYLKELNIGIAKVVLILRSVSVYVLKMQIDPRFDKRRYSIMDNIESNFSITQSTLTTDLDSTIGFKALLSRLENGESGNLIVNTSINIDNATIPVNKINNSYEAIKHVCPSFNLPRSCGEDKHWTALLADIKQLLGSFDKIFEHYALNDDLEANFYNRIIGLEYKNWLYFIALKIKVSNLSNSYLRFVLNNTSRFEDFKNKILNEIIDIQPNDKRFQKFYSDRKKLVSKFPESDIANFVINNRKDISTSIYRLTDNTRTEREEIIAWIAKNRIPSRLSEIYPALSAYLKQYVFNCGELSNLLTDYFEAYKRQKVSNTLEECFLRKVDYLAKNRIFNRLPTRNEIIDQLNKFDSFLYWIDALGAEYLAYISDLVHARGLSISIKIVRAELPTITSINRGFFDDWEGDKKRKIDDLDNVKHNETGGYNFEDNVMPIHLSKELEIIEKIIDKVATELALRHYKRFFILSDHGASRLAVLRRKEEMYETDTKGERSGRCCKLFEPYDLPFAAEENSYLVLADYGRFKGSRAANVEVHGGASLEEVVVPVIEITLKNSQITVELVEKSVTVDFRNGAAITLFSNVLLEKVSVVLNGKRYIATKTDDNHYKVLLPDVKRAGEYEMDLYTGDDLIDKIIFQAQGKSAKINDDFDELF